MKVGGNSVSCIAQTDRECVGGAGFQIRTPASITLALDASTLKRLPNVHEANCTAASPSNGQYAYQTTNVRVLADTGRGNVDVTALALGLWVDDTSVAYILHSRSGQSLRSPRGLSGTIS